LKAIVMIKVAAVEKPRIMLVGMGNLSSNLLSLLLLDPATDRIVLAGRDIEKCRRRANLARFTAYNLDAVAVPEVVQIDLHDVDRTSETLAVVKPDIIFMGASLQSWRRITELPSEAFEALDEAQFGPWLPMHLTLNYLLMQAVRRSGISCKVVNAAFPDAVGPVLAKVGLAPTIGIGNVANIVPALVYAAASLLEVDPSRVEVRLVAQHYFSHYVPRFGTPGRSRYHLSVRVDGESLHTQVDDAAIFAQLNGHLKRLGGIDGQVLTASSAARIIKGLVSEAPIRAHAPAPDGLPGGYPIRLSRSAIALDLADGMDCQEAIQINEACQQADGIEAIDADGTVTFAEAEMEIMHKLIGYRCRTMKLSQSANWADELGKKYAKFAEALGPLSA